MKTFEKLLVQNFNDNISLFTNDANKYPFKIATMSKTLLYSSDNAQADAEYIARAVNNHADLIAALEKAILSVGKLGVPGFDLQLEWLELLKRIENEK